MDYFLVHKKHSNAWLEQAKLEQAKLEQAYTSMSLKDILIESLASLRSNGQLVFLVNQALNLRPTHSYCSFSKGLFKLPSLDDSSEDLYHYECIIKDLMCPFRAYDLRLEDAIVLWALDPEKALKIINDD